MKNYSGKFYEVVLSLIREDEKGTPKKVKETHVTKACTFGEAEETIIALCQDGAEKSVVNINPAQYKEVWVGDSPDDDKWFKVCVSLPVIDERSGKEKCSKTYFLVSASSTESAQKYTDDEIMRGTICDYDILSITCTNIVDFYDKGK